MKTGRKQILSVNWVIEIDGKLESRTYVGNSLVIICFYLSPEITFPVSWNYSLVLIYLLNHISFFMKVSMCLQPNSFFFFNLFPVRILDVHRILFILYYFFQVQVVLVLSVQAGTLLNMKIFVDILWMFFCHHIWQQQKIKIPVDFFKTSTLLTYFSWVIMSLYFLGGLLFI